MYINGRVYFRRNVGFTMMDIRIDALSNDNFKGTYYSLAGLQNLGALLAPIIGGVCLDIIQQGWIIFGLLSIITSFSILFSIKVIKLHNNQNRHCIFKFISV